MMMEPIGPYEITRELGRGGMGVVYLARDTRLDRQVAIKALPAELASDPARLERFEREARTLAGLSHPNIAGIYGIEEQDDAKYLVLEFVEGETLADVLDRGPLPIDEAIEYAVQIAAGVEAAHEAGVIHRDLKPANIIVTPDGQAKVLDFGLARTEESQGSSTNTEAATLTSPAIQHSPTMPGVILGTAAYMSPEQARGRKVDKRTDIWSFGVLLYEMLTGIGPFRGETVTDSIGAILHKDVDLDRLPPGVPMNVRRALRRCLERDKARRYRDIGDVAIDLQDVASDPIATDSTLTGNRRGAWIAGLIAVLVLGFVGGSTLFRGQAPVNEVASEPVVRSSIRLPEGVQLDGSGTPVLALSPDGSTLALVGRSDEGAHLYLRHMDSGETVRVPESHGAEGPFFSPDGKWVGFGCGPISGASPGLPRLSKAPVNGGPTQTLCTVRDYFGGAWRDDGTIYWIDAMPGRLWSVNADGGTPREVGDAQASALLWPQILPGDESALAIDVSVRRGEVVRINTKTGAITQLGIQANLAVPLPTGHLLLGRVDARELVLQRFDLARGEAIDGQAVVLRGVSATRNGGTAFAASSEGTLVYSVGPLLGSRREITEIMRLGFDGTLTPIELPADRYQSISLSPNGKRLVAAIDDTGLWIIDLARGTRLRLPSGDTFSQWRPLWSPDGAQVVWTGIGGAASRGSLNLFVQPADGVSQPRQLDDRVGEFWAQTWVPETQMLVDMGWHAQEADPVFSIVPIDGSRQPEIMLQSPGNDITSPRIRSDGKWIAYSSDESGQRAAYLRSLPDLTRKIPVGQANQVRWSIDGRQLILIRNGVFRSVSVTDAADGGLTLGEDVEFARIEGVRDVQVDPLGQGLIVLRQTPGTGTVTQLEMVRGWFREVEELLPAR